MDDSFVITLESNISMTLQTAEYNQTVPGNPNVSDVFDITHTATTLTVLKDHTDIITKDITITINQNWNPKDNFISAVGKDGENIDFNDLTVNEIDVVNTTIPGMYTVSYRYNNKEVLSKVIVKDIIINPNTPTTPNTDITPTQNLILFQIKIQTLLLKMIPQKIHYLILA